MGRASTLLHIITIYKDLIFLIYGTESQYTGLRTDNIVVHLHDLCTGRNGLSGEFH